ncbi:MAG: ankyrin repeat domain-containing protein [bacterium]|nr:ankyrin repeat domain-containing protein [bacterium]
MKNLKLSFIVVAIGILSLDASAHQISYQPALHSRLYNSRPIKSLKKSDFYNRALRALFPSNTRIFMNEVSSFLGLTGKKPSQRPGKGGEKRSGSSKSAKKESASGSRMDSSSAEARHNIFSSIEGGACGGGGEDPDRPSEFKKELSDCMLEVASPEQEKIEKLLEKIALLENEEHIIALIKEYMLGQYSCVNNADRHGNTLLHMSARRGLISVLKFLLELGADPNLCNDEGEVPATLAMEYTSDSFNFFDDEEDLVTKKLIYDMLQLLIQFNAELFTNFYGSNRRGAMNPFDSVDREADPELYKLLLEAHLQRQLEVVRVLWDRLSPELQHKFVKTFSYIAYLLGVKDLRAIDPRFLSIEQVEADIEILKQQFDNEFLLSELIMRVVEEKVNCDFLAINDEWEFLQLAGSMFLDIFRELSLSSVDVMSAQSTLGMSAGSSHFVSLSLNPETGDCIRLLHRVPHTFVVVYKPTSARSPSPARVYLGRTASRTLATRASGRPPSRQSAECLTRVCSSPALMSRLSVVSRSSGGTPECCSLLGSRTPQQCGEFDAFSRAIAAHPECAESGLQFVAVPTADLVCDYRFFREGYLAGASPNPKPPCLNCCALYPGHVYQGTSVSSQFMILEDAQGVIQNIEVQEPIQDQIDGQVYVIATILLDNGEVIDVDIRISAVIFKRLKIGKIVMFNLLRNEPRNLALIKEVRK